MIVGARDNQLIGSGLVVGLNGQGDSDPIGTRTLMSNMMKKFGNNIRPADVKAKNVAQVALTALIGPFARNGSKIDVYVSSSADAKSLQGGSLLQTPLYGADGRIYAVSQGPVSIGGFAAGNSGASMQKNHPTSGKIPGGAIVEREIPTNLFSKGVLQVALRESDFTSATRMKNAINQAFGRQLAMVENGSTVNVYLPPEMQGEAAQNDFVTRVENVVFRPDSPARIVFNEKTGTIVANSRIRIDEFAVSHGNLTISIVNTPVVSQPNANTGNVGVVVAGSGGAGGAAAAGVVGQPSTPLVIGSGADARIVYQDKQGNQIQLPVDQEPPSDFEIVMTPSTGQPGVTSPGAPGGNAIVSPGAQTVVTTQTTLNVNEEKKSFQVLDDMTTLQEVANGLNALGATPRDMMAIFTEMKKAGVLQADLISQ